MIITKQKDLGEILTSLNDGAVFIAGCSECAALCHTGGEPEVLAMIQTLERKNIKVVGSVVLDPACHLNNNRRLLKAHKEELEQAKKILVLACGNGVQTVAESIPDKEVIAGTDTVFLGEIIRANDFEKRCVMCAECIVDQFDGLCPISRCPKSMLNGPCGGSMNGKCEVDSNLDCVWNVIYDRLKQNGQLHRLKRITEPKNWAKSTSMEVFLKTD
jgi:hypothetical protein